MIDSYNTSIYRLAVGGHDGPGVGFLKTKFTCVGSLGLHQNFPVQFHMVFSATSHAILLFVTDN